MASWTDSNQPSQFTPYIQQIPIEAETQVGQTKQAQYDQGYQRIQSQIDKVAGLSVMRDVDKNYLQSKMNELGNNLKMVSMGDFSNYQLVNSVGGMVNQVGNDPYVQAAVESTAKISNEMSAMKTARAAGKSDANNEEYFNEKVLAPYMNAGLKDSNGDPVSFNGNYTPYVDITSEVQKLAKDAGVDDNVLQQMYVTDANGKIMFDKQGNAIPARTMTQVENSSNAKALQGIMTTVLSRGDVQNQMSIDAWANTRGQDPNALLAGYKQDYNDRFNAIDDQIVKWNTLLAGNVSDDQKADLQNNIKQLTDSKAKYQNQLKQLTALAQSNPDAFKEQIYKNNYENSLMDMFLKTKKEEKNLESPITKQMDWEADYKLKSEMERANLAVAQGHLALDKEIFSAEWIKNPDGTYTKNTATGKPGDGGEFTGHNPQETKVAAVQNANDINSLKQKSDDIGLSLMYDIYTRAPNMPKQTMEQFTESINQKAKAEGISPEDEVYSFLKDADNHAKLMGVQLSGRDRGTLGAYINTHDDYTNRLAITSQVRDESYKHAGINIDDYTSALLPVSFVRPDGTTESYSKEDIFNAVVNKNTDVLNRIDEGLKDKYGAGTSVGLPFGTGSPPPTSTYAYRGPEGMAIQELRNKFGTDGKLKSASEEQEKEFQKFIPTDDVITLPPDAKKEDREAVKQRLAALLQGSQKGDLTGDNYNPEAMISALGDEKSVVSYNIHKPFTTGAPTTGTAHVSLGKTTYNVDINNQSNLETATGKKFEGYNFNSYYARAITNKSYSTNLGADPTEKDAYKTCMINPSNPEYAGVLSQLQNSKRYIPLGADLKLAYGDKNWNTFVYLYDKQIGDVRYVELDHPYPLGSENQIINHLSTQLDDAQVNKILEDRKK
jgi:hypothetical protein